MWPLNISVLPPPVPRQVPSAFARPSSTCCHCTCRPSSSYSSTISSAIACSSPVKLWTSISELAVSTSRSRSTFSTGRPSRAGRGSSGGASIVGSPAAHPRLEAAVEVARISSAEVDERRRREARRVALRADEDQRATALREHRVREARRRVAAPFEHRARHVHRARDDAVAIPLVVRAQVDEQRVRRRCLGRACSA